MNVSIREAPIEENTVLEYSRNLAAKHGCKILQLYTYEYEAMSTDTKRTANDTPRIPVHAA